MPFDVGEIVAALTLRDDFSAKMKVAGGQVTDFEINARKAVAQTNSLEQAFKQADNTLGLFGVNLGPEVRAIEEIAAVAGKSATEIGLLGTAGLVLGTGIAAWKITRAVAEFTGLDKAIGNALAKLLKWGDLAGEEAGAKADALAAQQRGIGLAFGATHTPMEKAAYLVKTWRAEIDKLVANGNVDALSDAVREQIIPLDKLAEMYHISNEALGLFAKELRESDAAAEAQTKTLAKNADQIDKLGKALDEERKRAAARQRKEFEDWLAQGTKVEENTRAIVRAEQEAAAAASRLAREGATAFAIIQSNARKAADEVERLKNRTFEMVFATDELARAEFERDARKSGVISVDTTPGPKGPIPETFDEMVARLKRQQRGGVNVPNAGGGSAGGPPSADPAAAARNAAEDAQFRADEAALVALANAAQDELKAAKLAFERAQKLGASAEDLAKAAAAFLAAEANLQSILDRWKALDKERDDARRGTPSRTSRGSGGGAAGIGGLVASGGDALTAIRGGPTPIIVNVNMHVSGVWDPRTVTDMTRRVNDEMLRHLMMGRQLGTQ